MKLKKKDKNLLLQKQKIELLSHESLLRDKDLEKARLELEYESEARQQNSRLASIEAAEKDNNIQLQKKSIDLLKKEAELKESRVSKVAFMRDISFIGAALFLVIMLLLYNRYRLKKRNSQVLAQKNSKLEVLVNEKELLLKEVHHRVKNNLQIIISLLESQAHFLSADALIAIQKSQHRVYAMSLIHQKLYQHDNATSVKMDQYLHELICYLQDSFETGSTIRFDMGLEPIELDLSQAIPLGLILNEAITNAIKYAFLGKKEGTIKISLTQTSGEQIQLQVSDNGIGLPEGWENRIHQSLGVKLMRGLSEDIQAYFEMRSEQGTCVEVKFEKGIFG